MIIEAHKIINIKKNLLGAENKQQKVSVYVIFIVTPNTIIISLSLTSAPNHNCPARFSCRTSSGNFTLKSRLARSSPMRSSIMAPIIFNTLSCDWRNWFTRDVQRSGSLRPSKLSNSLAIRLNASSAKKNCASNEVSSFCKRKNTYDYKTMILVGFPILSTNLNGFRKISK